MKIAKSVNKKFPRISNSLDYSTKDCRKVKKCTGSKLKAKFQSIKSFGEKFESLKHYGNPKDFPKNWGKIRDDEGQISRNSKQLRKFVLYCLENPELRFWQAIRNHFNVAFVLTATGFDFDTRTYTGIRDTFKE